MSYVYAFDHPYEGTPTDIKALVGGKAAAISVMVQELGLPVPPGFTISTSACRSYLEGTWPEGLDNEIRSHLSRLEETVGRGFGDAADPLLVSVRSGAPVSMPGMMDTILNVGLNDATTDGLATQSGDPEFAQACRSRLEQMYTDIVAVAAVPTDPWEQLRTAIEAVFRSWNSERAMSYRLQEGIPDDLGTAVTVQAMVFGNRGHDSATGVLFTRNPATGESSPYGDIMFRAQGEDVVAGTHNTEPLSVLSEAMPTVADELWRHADSLESHYADMCDIEFTVEEGRLWMLQVRIGKRSPQAALRIAVDMAEDDRFPLSRAEAVTRVAEHLVDPPTEAHRARDARAIATGMAASPGLASGEIATSADAAVTMAEEGRRVILVREETSPHDVHGMAKAAGILTSRGGLTSHAAVVARGWGVPAVVGASMVRVAGGTVWVGDRELRVGDTLSIDGATGEIFDTEIVTAPEIVPEAEILLTWAQELGIEIGGAEDTTVTTEGENGIADQPGRQRVMLTLLIKGFATADQIAVAHGTTPHEAGSILDRIAADGLAELTGGMFTLTSDGKAAAEEMMAIDRERWGVKNAIDALDAFLEIDLRVKEVVTAWQMREVDGEQVINDHSDQDYDASVLNDFASVHADAVDWLEPLVDGLPRLDDYAARLKKAAELAQGGDHAYIASPLVDSYHSIWFELHEDLILLAGRTREDEAAAGRA